MASGGGARAWQFLKRSPDYREAWRGRSGAAPEPEEAPFPVWRRLAGAGEAARFGLLALEDPWAGDGPASPFWAVAPMMEVWPAPADGPGLAALAREAGAALSGLRLDDGALVLKVERHGRALQLRIADGAGFDLESGTVEFRLRHGRSWPRAYARSGALWRIAGIPAPRRGRGAGLTRFCSHLTATWPG